jgi:hypothetical protein
MKKLKRFGGNKINIQTSGDDKPTNKQIFSPENKFETESFFVIGDASRNSSHNITPYGTMKRFLSPNPNRPYPFVIMTTPDLPSEIPMEPPVKLINHLA